MSQARLPRTEPSTELITAHKVNTATLMPPVQTRDFSALPKHRVDVALGGRSLPGSVEVGGSCGYFKCG